MGDFDHLMRGILAQPHDDLPRLVMADWLQEQGQEARGEFIRVQVQRARLTRDEKCDHENDAVADSEGYIGCVECGLKKREHELLLKHEYEWMSCISARVPRVIKRGFIEEVRLTLLQFMAQPCWRCHGDGKDEEYEGSVPADAPLCRVCLGKGNSPKYAENVFRSQPIIRIKFSDVRPYMNLPHTRGAVGLARGLILGHNYGLFEELWDRLVNQVEYSVYTPHRLNGVDMKWFKSDHAASSALSRVAVATGREKAELPHLELA